MDKIIKEWRRFLKESNSYQVYCDMDGVLVDLIGGLRKEILSMDLDRGKRQSAAAVLESKEEWQDLEDDPQLGPGVQVIYSILNDPDVNKRVRFWAELPATKYMKDLWDYIIDEEPIILSAPWKINGQVDEACKRGKEIWIDRYQLNPKKVILTRDKAAHAARNHILIDDMKKYLDSWAIAGGIAIEHKTVIDTIKELDTWLQ